MLRALFVFILGSFIFQQAQAQKKDPDSDTLFYYVKNNGYLTGNKDCADFSLLIMPKDTANKNDLYRVIEYYPNGTRKLNAASSVHSIDVVLQGLA